MSGLREVLEARANSGAGVITHTDLREILAKYPVERPIVRNVELTNGETVLDEVVALEAAVHLECMADNHWWLLVESGGVRVDVNLGTKRAKISAIAEES